jgi:hypothetical protein
MANTRSAKGVADGPVQTIRALDLKSRMVLLALAHDTDALGALGDEYAKSNPVVLASVAALLAQDYARLSEKSAAVAAAAISRQTSAGLAAD